jgi:hypothetical protein
MHHNGKLSFQIFLCSLCFLSLTASCQSRSKVSEGQSDKKPALKVFNKIGTVTFYLENSESMFGYVSSISDYVDVVSELAQKPEFVKENIARDFYFINGIKLNITHLGNNPSVLIHKLNTTGFNCGDITRSNLNSMFQVALGSANNNNISILISDGIYDIGDQALTSLVTLGKDTRSKFIRRLQLGDFQTIMIKLNSQFKGNYFCASKGGKVSINSVRPYYIWIFGDSRLLNKYFTDEYISQNLRGYQAIARFMKTGNSNVSYQATSENLIGSFEFDRKETNCLSNAKTDRHGLGFQFAIAVDYSSLPFPESYLSSVSNYSINNDYVIVSIKKPLKKIFTVSFTPTYLITVKAKKSLYGDLIVSLKNNIPSWIATTDSNSESNIQSDKTHTFGIKYLTDGIIQAYQSESNEKNIASFKIKIR